MTTRRIRYIADFDYPGTFLPESVSREITEPTLEAALEVAPDEDGYFRKDGWYAVEILQVEEKLWTSGDDTRWMATGPRAKLKRYVIGNAIKADDMEPTDGNRILIANIRSNSPSQTGILTRCGNWQPLMEYDVVLDSDELAAVSA